jgi:C6 transcription factor Pro1
LEITCYYGDKKPEWMDGGEREKQMAEHLKAMVRSKANLRREKKWVMGVYSDEADSAQASSTDNDALSHRMASAMSLEPGTEPESVDTSGDSPYTPDTSATTSPQNSHSDGHTGQPSVSSSSKDNKGWTTANVPNGMDFSNPDLEKELNFSMMYLDHIFPYMLPFYRPHLLLGGRGWMLVVLMRNKALYHTALSLASYFLSLLIGASNPTHPACLSTGRKELQKQQELSIKELQQSMKRLTASGVAENFQQSLHCLEAIVQVLLFENAISNMGSWQMHLDAASSIFEQILEHHGTDPVRPWYSILSGMNDVALTIDFPTGGHPWSSDQASLRFLTINLLWTDVLAATVLERAPRLQPYHAQLLGGPAPLLSAEEFLGCHSWVITCIGDIAALAAWKREMRASGALSVVELVRRAALIETRLRAGLEQLLAAVPADAPLQDPSARGPNQTFYASGFETAIVVAATSNGDSGGSTEGASPFQFSTTPSQAFHTQVWAHAALAYLTVVVSGFQPQLPDIETNVRAVMELFIRMPSPLCLRTFVWPYAVAGCLAKQCQEEFFRGLVTNMGAMQVFGTVREALEVMSAVWSHRSCMDPDSWDIATCFNVLGHKSLLV